MTATHLYKASKPLTKKPVGVEVAGETPSLTREFVGETDRVLEHTQNHPPRNQHQKGLICLWVAEEVTESQLRAEQVKLFPLGPLPNIRATIQQSGLLHPGKYLGSSPSYITGALRQRNTAQMKEQIKAPEKEQSDKEIDSQHI